MKDLTTLQLARRIADAVYLDFGRVTRSSTDTLDPPTQSVIRVLHDTGSWFCRLTETPQGTVETAYEQVELFP